MATLILSVLSRQSWFGDGAGSTRIVSAFSLSLEVYVNLILSLMGGTLRYGLGCIVHFTLSQNPQDKASISSLILQPLSMASICQLPTILWVLSRVSPCDVNTRLGKALSDTGVERDLNTIGRKIY